MPFTLRNIKKDLEDIGPRFDGAPDLEFRAATKALELEKGALSYQRVPPGYRFPYGHTHETQEEVYVVVRGSGRMKLDDDIVELAEWDAVRVPPGTWRGYEAGPEGLEILVIGAPNLRDHPRGDVEAGATGGRTPSGDPADGPRRRRRRRPRGGHRVLRGARHGAPGHGRRVGRGGVGRPGRRTRGRPRGHRVRAHAGRHEPARADEVPRAGRGRARVDGTEHARAPSPHVRRRRHRRRRHPHAGPRRRAHRRGGAVQGRVPALLPQRARGRHRRAGGGAEHMTDAHRITLDPAPLDQLNIALGYRVGGLVIVSGQASIGEAGDIVGVG